MDPLGLPAAQRQALALARQHRRAQTIAEDGGPQRCRNATRVLVADDTSVKTINGPWRVYGE
jgi:hypothetical protein